MDRAGAVLGFKLLATLSTDECAGLKGLAGELSLL